jgi:hypothetical protein
MPSQMQVAVSTRVTGELLVLSVLFGPNNELSLDRPSAVASDAYTGDTVAMIEAAIIRLKIRFGIFYLPVV